MTMSPEKEAELRRRMAALGIDESDLTEKFVRGSGSGGQKINKTSSCVYLRHRPSGIEVKCQAGRSQALNRLLARRLLCERLEAVRDEVASAAEQARERIRRQKRRRSRKQKERMFEAKRRTGEKKSGRTRVARSTED